MLPKTYRPTLKIVRAHASKISTDLDYYKQLCQIITKFMVLES